MNFLTNKTFLRRLHRQLAPMMILPLLITLLTGILFDLAANMDKTDDFVWLLEWHRGNFKVLNLEKFYPFLNAFGLLILLLTGTSMWLQTRSKTKRVNNNGDKRNE